MPSALFRRALRKSAALAVCPSQSPHELEGCGVPVREPRRNR